MEYHSFPGEYKVQLPDGRVQIVSYEADDYGFRPTVHYEYPDEPHQALDVGGGGPPHHHPGTADSSLSSRPMSGTD